jgi:hypothetical protein
MRIRRLPTVAVTGLSIAAGALAAVLLYKHAWRFPIVQNLRGAQLFCALWILATPVAAVLAALGRLATWSSALKGAAICLSVTVPAYGLTGSVEKVRNASRDKAVLCNLRQLAAAADQYCLENNVSVVERLDELVGPTKYIKALNAVLGEDYRANFPLRNGDILSAEFPNGRIINYASGPTPPGYKHVFEPGERPPWRVKQPAVPAPITLHPQPETKSSTTSATVADDSNEAYQRALGAPPHHLRRGKMCASCHAKKT